MDLAALRTLAARKRSVTKRLVCALILLPPLVITICCDINFDACKTDADCNKGLRCNRELLGTTCERPCSKHADCSPSEYCDTNLLFSTFAVCRIGCREDTQCGQGQICSTGTCQSGCHEDSQCAIGTVCPPPGIFFSAYSVRSCVPGCRSESECSGNEHCICQSCSADQCRSEADCPRGSFCTTEGTWTVFGSCSAGQCRQLPPSSTCGGITCDPWLTTTAWGFKVAIAPCCQSDACGFDLSPFLESTAACRAPGQPGTIDSSCPSPPAPADASPSPLIACRRTDGRCGYMLSDTVENPLGCVLGE
jgi:hypothetical protein